MKAVIQRVSRARVVVAGEVVGEIERGLLVLVCAMRGDTATEARALAEKIAHWRCFGDEAGKMNLSAIDLALAVLVVSQFTLSADGSRGRRPSFDSAAPPEVGRALCENFVETVRALGLEVQTGRFGAHMEVELVNDGPVTFALEVPPRGGERQRGDPSQVLA
ncbi:MAG: D-tyrosyl-tRNA(Tyr) deacylase [Planctomycetes bacterium]|nr:D-tyrosyl-tRNA(Tyr) deacylase [Planctomycetota bacterium]